LEFKRYHRVGEQIHKEISSLLLKGLKDPRIGFVTITAVDVTADMRYAKVFFTVMGDDLARSNSEQGLNSSASFIRRELGKRLGLRYIPEISFHFDASLDYGNRIESLLREIHTGHDDDSGDTEKD